MFVLERISTAIPWPRGIVVVGVPDSKNERVFILGRGAHRGQGGPNNINLDKGAGCIFEIDQQISEPVVPEQYAGSAVASNLIEYVSPTTPPFKLWQPNSSPPPFDKYCDRPYAGMAFGEISSNFFVCAYSGVDIEDPPNFIKNATDAVFRFDQRTKLWSVVEQHDDTGEGGLGDRLDTSNYPHQHLLLRLTDGLQALNL